MPGKWKNKDQMPWQLFVGIVLIVGVIAWVLVILAFSVTGVPHAR